jgi:CMP-N-acetylneuraminic acid synthetase
MRPAFSHALPDYLFEQVLRDQQLAATAAQAEDAAMLDLEQVEQETEQMVLMARANMLAARVAALLVMRGTA